MDLTDFYGIWGSEVKHRARGRIFVGPSGGWVGGSKQGCRRGNDRFQPLFHDESEAGISITSRDEFDAREIFVNFGRGLKVF